MFTLTPKESLVLLTLFKDFTGDYNANSLSKKIGLTSRGTLKILKNLNIQKLITGKTMGKAIFYKINLEDSYTLKVLETLFISEAREKASRWLAEFQELFSETEMALIFGSAIRSTKEANDIDLLLVFPQKKLSAVQNFIKNKNKILLKPIHPLIQTPEDLKKNLRKKDPVILNALRQGYVLHGYEQLIKVVRDVTSI